jgi:hypothetical protein
MTARMSAATAQNDREAQAIHRTTVEDAIIARVSTIPAPIGCKGRAMRHTLAAIGMTAAQVLAPPRAQARSAAASSGLR